MKEAKVFPSIDQASALYQSGEIPWVRRMALSAMCSGVRYGRARKECRNSARWRWVRDENSPDDRSGNFCWAHLLSHAGGTMGGLNRLGLFLEDQGYVLNTSDEWVRL